MDLPPERAEMYADILQILAHRSGKVHMMTAGTLRDNYFPNKSDDFVNECIRALHCGDFPVNHTGSLVELTDKQEAEHIIVEIRENIFNS